MTPEELCVQLKNLMQPDTAVVGQATVLLKEYFKEVEALSNLLIIISQNED